MRGRRGDPVSERAENATAAPATPDHNCAEWEAEYGVMRDALIRVAWFSSFDSDAFKEAMGALQRRDLRYPADRPYTRITEAANS
jgi:hypothetical protein